MSPSRAQAREGASRSQWSTTALIFLISLIYTHVRQSLSDTWTDPWWSLARPHPSLDPGEDETLALDPGEGETLALDTGEDETLAPVSSQLLGIYEFPSTVVTDCCCCCCLETTVDATGTWRLLSLLLCTSRELNQRYVATCGQGLYVVKGNM